MINFYNAADNVLYKQPNSQFITQARFRGNVAPVPPELIEEENVTETFGIPNTKTFQSMNNDNNNFNYNNNNVGGFRTPGTGDENERFQTPSGNYVTNKTNLGNYIPGMKPEESFRDKIGGYIKTGIGAMIPGGNFLMGMAGKLDNFDNLSPFAQEYTKQQMNNQEQSMYGGNLTNQDRYGYNKTSALGDYDALVDKRVGMAKAWQAANPGKKLPNIHAYYLDKDKDKDTLKSQLDMNDKVRNHIMNQKAQAGPAINNPYSELYSGNVNSPNYIPTGPNQPDPGGGGGGAPPGFGKTSAGNYTNQFEGGDPGQNQGTQSQAGGFTAQDDARESYGRKDGGRIGYYFGGLAARGMKR